MDDGTARSLGLGLSQKGVRDHNERLILSLLQRQGSLPGSDLARQTGLSPTTVSAIIRKLMDDGHLRQGAPLRGKVGKPSVPVSLVADSVLGIGLTIGRRSAVLLLLDFCGNVIHRSGVTYDVPEPDVVLEFFRTEIGTLRETLGPARSARICGVGVAAPFELWNWSDQIGTTAERVQVWQEVDITREIETYVGIPVYLMNDATAACQAEQIFGGGKVFRDYAYIYIGTIIGGGIVLNNALYEGRSGNAGALGPLRTVGPDGRSAQLIDTASLHLLESTLHSSGIDPARLRVQGSDWSLFEPHLTDWIEATGGQLARASMSICAVIDFEAVIVDGIMPAHIRDRLVESIARHQATEDARGLLPPRIVAGVVGQDAKAIGAASKPIFSQFFLDTHSGQHGA